MPATRTAASATLRKTHDKSEAMATQSDVRRLLSDPAWFASKKPASWRRILANSVERSRRTTRFCTKAKRNTFQKSSAALTTPATTKAVTAARAPRSRDMAPPMARLTKCGAASENGRRANRESKPSVSHRASGRASDNRRRKPGADTPALSSAPRREPSRSKASSSAFDSGKGPESSSVDRRPKGPNRDAEPNARASSGSCGRSSERWATRKSRRVRTGAGGSHSLRWRDVRIRSGTGRIQRWMRATHQRFVHGSVHPRRESGSQQRTLQSILPRGRHRADVEAPKRPRLRT